ncbi:MAG: glutamate racemase [bacterium]
MTKTKRNKSIGIFDSGFGGLSILKGIVKVLPEYDYIYLGDTARAPYGGRTKETIFEFTKQAVDFLFNQNCGLIIIACNSASSDALKKIQEEYIPIKYPGKKVLGVLIPGAEVSALKTKNKRIGILATEATVNSKAFERELFKIDPKIKIFQKACPLLVPIVEEGKGDELSSEMIIKDYLDYFKDKDIDTLILGCTHYGILEEQIKKNMPYNVEVVSESHIIGKKLKDYLERKPEIEGTLSKDGQRAFFSTDTTNRFEKLGGKFFGKKIEQKKAKLI